MKRFRDAKLVERTASAEVRTAGFSQRLGKPADCLGQEDRCLKREGVEQRETVTLGAQEGTWGGDSQN